RAQVAIPTRSPCGLYCAGRRRHTSPKRDWSSDVCSSDLIDIHTLIVLHNRVESIRVQSADKRRGGGGAFAKWIPNSSNPVCKARSEERRVGEECRQRTDMELAKRRDRADREVGRRINRRQ